MWPTQNERSCGSETKPISWFTKTMNCWSGIPQAQLKSVNYDAALVYAKFRPFQPSYLIRPRPASTIISKEGSVTASLNEVLSQQYTHPSPKICARRYRIISTAPPLAIFHKTLSTMICLLSSCDTRRGSNT